MPGLPPLIQEDVDTLDAALDDLLHKSESTAALVIDKGGPLISQRGTVDRFDTTTISALAAGSFCATQAIAELLSEQNFASIYQQGDHHSLLLCNIDENVLLIVIFKATQSVGVVKYYAGETINRIMRQLQAAQQRSPDTTIDLVSMNVLDVSTIFHKQS
jgi:predicted regulator of Ras-like GTPase activity (Roadblock/LC7/MglB family)